MKDILLEIQYLILRFNEQISNISYESLFAYFFATLGIFITLVAIASTLNKEIRYKLLIKYYSKAYYNRAYVLILTISFILTICGYLLFNTFSKIFILFLVALLFLLTLYFSIYFLHKLNREYFNNLIVLEFKRELKTISSKDVPESLKDFSSNIGYVLRNNLDLTEEKEALKEIIQISLTKNNIEYPTFLIGNMEFIDEKTFEEFIGVIYDKKYQNENISYEDAILLQELLTKIIRESFLRAKNVIPHFNTSGLYLKESLDFRLIKDFENTVNEKNIESFKKLATNTVDNYVIICRELMAAYMPEDTKYTYLFTQLSYLNKCFDGLEHLREIDFSEKYYEYLLSKDENYKKNEIALVEKKVNLVKELKFYLQEKKLELLYFILYNIESGKLSKKFFNIVQKMYEDKDLKRVLFREKDILKLNFLNYDTFEGGAQFIAPFNYMKYKFLLFFTDFLKSENSISQIQSLDKEHFNISTKFDKESVKLEESFMDKFMSYEIEDLNKYNQKLSEQIKKKLKNIAEEEENYTSTSDPKEIYIKKFEDDVRGEWKKNQEILKEIVFIKKEKKEKKDEVFGLFKLQSKEWFLESFFKNVAYSRDIGINYGRNQVSSKNDKIFEKFYQNCLKQEDEIKLNKLRLTEDLKNILKKKGIYYFVYDPNEVKLYNFKNIEWERDIFSEARLKWDDIEVRFYPIIKSKINFIFEKKAVILNQYEKGFKDEKGELYVNINPDFDKDEIKKIIKSEANGCKTKNDVKKLVKVRIAEKFDVGRDKNKLAFKIKFI